MDELEFILLQYLYENPNGLNKSFFTTENGIFFKKKNPIFKKSDEDWIKKLDSFHDLHYVNTVGDPRMLPSDTTFQITEIGKRIYEIEITSRERYRNHEAKLMQLKQAQKTQGCWILILTLVLALTSVFPAMQSLIEIYKFFYCR